MAWPIVNIDVDAASEISISMMAFDLMVILNANNTPSLVPVREPIEKRCSPANVKGRKSQRKISREFTGISRLKTSFICILAEDRMIMPTARAVIKTTNRFDTATTTEKRMAITILTRGSRR
jgi:hypothetical protein